MPFDLLERGGKRPRVDLGDDIPRLDHLTLHEADMHELAIDAAADNDVGKRCDRAQAGQVDRQITALGTPGEHRNGARRSWTRAWTPPLTRWSRRLGLPGVQDISPHQHAEEQHHHH